MIKRTNLSGYSIIAVFLLGIVSVAGGRTIYVDDDEPADFNNIQAAIADSNDGDTIIIADGVYTGPGNRDIDFNGKAITARSANGPTNCIIDCNGTESDRHRGFVFWSGENANSAIIGFTITNGHAPLEYIPPPTSMWFSQGGAIYCYGSSPTITNCIISGNSAYANYGYGGGIYTSGGSPTITNCTFSSNWANYQGGGINSYYGSPTITNCTFSSNRANYFGGGIACDWPGNVTLTNCILWRNIARYGSQQISDYGSSTVTYSDVQGGWSGPGNINTDPCFADPCNGDYHLKAQAGRWEPLSQSWVQDDVTSPCIDAGNPMSPIGLEPFPNGGRINMGAYGGTAEASKSYFGLPVCETVVAGDINGDCKVNFLDFRIMALHWLEDRRPPDSNTIVEDGIKFYIQTDKTVYELGEHTEILYRITNLTDEVWSVARAVRIMDIIVEIKEGESFREVWRYGWEHSTLPGPQFLGLQPGESRELRVPWAQFGMTRTGDPWEYHQAPPGTYRITGVVDGYRTRPEPPMEIHIRVSVDITVVY